MRLNIRKIRKARGMTQEVLAEKLGTTQGIVSRYETGKIALEWPRIVEIAQALGCPVVALLPSEALGGVDPMLLRDFLALDPEKQALVRQMVLAMAAPEAPLSLPAPPRPARD